MLSFNVSTAGDEFMGGVGATWRFGRKSPEELRQAEAEKAAKANIPAAQYNLSILYRYGEGVEKDIDLADTWRMRAAQNGFKLAIE